jgi:hypothetical protein
MLKFITIAAMAAISMAAIAQIQPTPGTEHANGRAWMVKGDIDVAGKSNYQLQKRIEMQAADCLGGADRFELDKLLSECPEVVETALLRGLSHAHRMAAVITDHMLAQRFGDNETMAITATSPLQATNLDYAGSESGSRPLRMVMMTPGQPKAIDNDAAIDILCAHLSAGESETLVSWWNGDRDRGATERQKFVVMRLLENDASMINQTFYPSVFTTRTYTWITATQ